LALASAGYYWWQKREAGQPSLSLKEANISCESLKNIPSVEYAPAEVKEQFIKCFPDRVGGVTSPVSVPSGVSGAPVKGTSPSLEASPSSCDPFAAMPSAQYCSAVPDSNGRALCEQCKTNGY